MAGLVPAIHVLAGSIGKKDVDARHKAGHDGVDHKPAMAVRTLSMKAVRCASVATFMW
jgi:hypothetical protein